jgi:hypothetical protein
MLSFRFKMRGRLYRITILPGLRRLRTSRKATEKPGIAWSETKREKRSAAEARLTELRTWELERLAGEHLAQPEDLLSIGGHGLADFLTPEGWVDQDAVADAAVELIESRPGLAKNPKVRATDHTQGTGSASSQSQPQWGDLFKK